MNCFQVLYRSAARWLQTLGSARRHRPRSPTTAVRKRIVYARHPATRSVLRIAFLVSSRHHNQLHYDCDSH